MPCRSDYMDPNESEKNSREVCRHLLYVLPRLGHDTPVWVTEGANNEYGAVHMLETGTQMLCSLCRGMTTRASDLIIYDGGNAKARKLADWWEEHQKADAKREELERTLPIKSLVLSVTNQLYSPVVAMLSFKDEVDAEYASSVPHERYVYRKGTEVFFYCDEKDFQIRL